MKTEMEVVELIIKKFKAKKYAEGPRNRFGFISDDGKKIIVSRERGKDTPIKREDIAQAVRAVRLEPAVHSFGPDRLRPYITKRILSPLWALLQLVSLGDIIE